MFTVFRIALLFLLVDSTVCGGIGPDSTQEEIKLITRFMNEEEILTKEDLIKQVGPFIDPPVFRHHNYIQMTDYLQSLHRQFPALTHLYTVGESVEGRQLWVFVVGKNPKEHTQGIPEFKYVANMHGNEVSGRVFLLGLAWTLLHNYHTNKYIRRLVDTTRIHMMPSMNPDGYEISTEGDESGVRGRTNANGKDLNRNFPSRFPNFFPSSELQPETSAVMNWTKSIPFVLSANLHGGTTIVNYPFDDYPSRQRDRKYAPAPDNELFVRLAYSYARAHDRMWRPGPRCLDDALNLGVDPQQGIVNGAHWYIVSGGMQDWNYLNTNCFELTIELNCVKFPKQKDLRHLWNENKYPLLHYIDQINNAIHGQIRDIATGEGIANATISIDNKSKIIVSYGNGEFWRLVNIGDYEITFDHPDYQPITKSISVTKDDRSPRLIVELDRLTTQKKAENRDVDKPRGHLLLKTHKDVSPEVEDPKVEVFASEEDDFYSSSKLLNPTLSIIISLVLGFAFRF